MERQEKLKERLDGLVSVATKGVRPPDYMIRFYNFMGRLPWKIGTNIFYWSGTDTKEVIRKAIEGHTDDAIQVLYEYRFRPRRFLLGLGDHLWQMSYNCRSVRSRGMFTREAVRFLLEKLNGSLASLIVVSLGSGSASQMLQGIADNYNHLDKREIRLILVDNDFHALETGQKNARRLGIEDLIDSRETTVGRFLREADISSVNLVEMVGLTDYFDEEKFQSYLRDIYRILIEGGFFLGANISSKEESAYAHGVACWPKMHYRPESQIRQSLEDAGFQQIWTGRCGLYTVWLAQKLSNP